MSGPALVNLRTNLTDWSKDGLYPTTDQYMQLIRRHLDDGIEIPFAAAFDLLTDHGAVAQLSHAQRAEVINICLKSCANEVQKGSFNPDPLLLADSLLHLPDDDSTTDSKVIAQLDLSKVRIATDSILTAARDKAFDTKIGSEDIRRGWWYLGQRVIDLDAAIFDA